MTTDTQERFYSTAEAARMIGCTPGTVNHYARRLFVLEQRAGKRFQLSTEQVEQLRMAISAPRPHQPKRQPPAPEQP